jgi:hypothetical protein
MIVACVTDYKTSQVARSSTMDTRGVGDIWEHDKWGVNVKGAELWTYSLAFEIPIRYNNKVHPGHHADRTTVADQDRRPDRCCAAFFVSNWTNWLSYAWFLVLENSSFNSV